MFNVAPEGKMGQRDAARLVPTGTCTFRRAPPPPPLPLTWAQGHMAALDGLRLVALAAPAALTAFAHYLPLLDTFPAARRALRPDRQTDRQTVRGGVGADGVP